MLTADIAVVGAGPAGVAAALTLARAGRDVVIFDKAGFPRDKCCGDGITTGALRRYEFLGLRTETVASWQVVDDVYVRGPSGHSVVFPLPRDGGMYAAVARRVDLDAAFLDVARAAGVKVYDGHSVIGASAGTDRVTLDVDGMGQVAARYAVGADGMWSPLRKLLGVDGDDPSLDGYRGEWHAFRQYFRGVSTAAESQLWVWFEPDLLPGYAWSFPLGDGRANVGFGLQREAGVSVRAMKGQWAELLNRPHIAGLLGPEAEAEAPHKAWPIPARLDAVRLSGAGGRALFVGDAARAADPMTGEGIGQALETGILAAEAMLGAGWRQPDQAAARYEAEIGRTMAVDHRLAALLSRALSHRKGVRIALRVAGSSGWARRNFGRWLFEDYPRAVMLTPGRWHRRMMAGPGAYQ